MCCHTVLTIEDVALVEKIIADLPILADLCRSDVQVYCRTHDGRVIVIAHSAPHSVAHIYPDGLTEAGQEAFNQDLMQTAFTRQPNPKIVYTLNYRGGLVARRLYPIRNAKGVLLAVMARDSYWLAHERHKRRSHAFQNAVECFIRMVLRGELRGSANLTPFGEHDGIIYVGVDRTVLYMSGVAAGLYRHLGYRDSIEGRRITELSPVEQHLFSEALRLRQCVESQNEQGGLTWVRKALPITRSPALLERWGIRKQPSEIRLQGVFILVHDATETIQTQREIESKMALIREVHHRVKNNLQVIASLMRMQARRTESEEAKTLLEESVNRVLSVAVVHEFLSQNANGNINLQEVAHRITSQIMQGLVDPSRNISLKVSGDAIWLPAERATQCALVINELVQNALEHGLEQRQDGTVQVQLLDLGDLVKVVVSDDGEGLPAGFDLSSSSSLGLRIVRSLVERDLRGHISLENDSGTRAEVVFAKSILGG